MILTRTPFRISFAGGGSDLRSFYSRRPGAVVSTTIDKAMYVAIHPYFHDKIRIKYSKTEDVASAAEVEHAGSSDHWRGEDGRGPPARSATRTRACPRR